MRCALVSRTSERTRAEIRDPRAARLVRTVLDIALRDSRAGSRVSFRSAKQPRCTRPGQESMTTSHDGIILGAGHNGLILQAYLGKAGLKTLAIDRRPVAGGGLSTLEDPRHPGFLHNTHAFFQRAITAMPWYGDLALARHGAHYIEPELNVALLTADGRALEWWTDPHKTI